MIKWYRVDQNFIHIDVIADHSIQCIELDNFLKSFKEPCKGYNIKFHSSAIWNQTMQLEFLFKEKNLWQNMKQFLLKLFIRQPQI